MKCAVNGFALIMRYANMPMMLVRCAMRCYILCGGNGVARNGIRECRCFRCASFGLKSKVNKIAFNLHTYTIIAGSILFVGIFEIFGLHHHYHHHSAHVQRFRFSTSELMFYAVMLVVCCLKFANFDNAAINIYKTVWDGDDCDYDHHIFGIYIQVILWYSWCLMIIICL